MSSQKREQFDRKCQVRLNSARKSAPNDSGGRGRPGGEGKLGNRAKRTQLQAYCLRFSCAFPLAINFAHSFEQLFKEDCKPVYLGPSGTLRGETNTGAVQSYLTFSIKLLTFFWLDISLYFSQTLLRNAKLARGCQNY